MLTGVITIGSLIWLLESSRLRIAAAAMMLTLLALTTVYLDWGRREYGDRYIEVHVPPLPANSVVLIATLDPVAYFIPYAEPRAQYVGIETDFLRLAQNNKLASEVKRVMRTPGRPKFVLNSNELDRNKMNGLLEHFDLKLGALPCQPIRSNLEVDRLSLCQLAGR